MNFKTYDNPFIGAERTEWYKHDLRDQKIEARLQAQEQAANALFNERNKVTQKEKLVNEYKNEEFKLTKNHKDPFIEKTWDKYNKISDINKDKECIIDDSIKKSKHTYYDKYVNNAHIPSSEELEKEAFNQEKERKIEQGNYNANLNKQIEQCEEIRNKYKNQYKDQLKKEQELAEQKYQANEKKKQEAHDNMIHDFVNTNKNLVDFRNEITTKNNEANLEFEKGNAKLNEQQLNYLEKRDYDRNVNKKRMYKEALDRQIENKKNFHYYY